jgi:hypothetical protein
VAEDETHEFAKWLAFEVEEVKAAQTTVTISWILLGSLECALED